MGTGAAEHGEATASHGSHADLQVIDAAAFDLAFPRVVLIRTEAFSALKYVGETKEVTG